MGEQKNLFLAIGISVAIIIIFQFLFPQQSVMTPQIQNETNQIQPSTSIDQNQQIIENIVKYIIIPIQDASDVTSQFPKRRRIIVEDRCDCDAKVVTTKTYFF